MTSKDSLSTFIKAEALRLGFCACGIAKAEPVDEAVQQHLRQWLDEDKCADMDYMRNYFDKRTNPCLLVEGARSVISVALSYYPQRKLDDSQLQFAYYAYGQDYHEVMKKKLRLLFDNIKQFVDTMNSKERRQLLNGEEEFAGRAFCDTAPMLEKYWAWKCGLGWIGKHTQLVTKQAGSFIFLGELVVNANLNNDEPLKNGCGKCDKCLNACPTKALEREYTLNARKCLSYLTIENKENIPDEAVKSMQTCVYGCDRCIKACPWNKFASPTTEQDFLPRDEFMNMTPSDWANLDIETYRRIFKGSAVKRAKFEGLQRNIKCVLSNLDIHTKKEG